MHTDVLQHLMAIGAALRERGAEPPTDAYFAGAAHWAQETLTRAMLHLSEVAAARCATPNLCLAGGVGLNIVANRAIRDRVEARGGRIFIQPAATDAGIPLGCAVYGYYALLGGTLPFQSNLVYLGPEHDQAAAEALLVSRGGRIHDDVFAATADLLKANKIVGWWQGRSEYGPRSLGSRSILCSPRTPWMKDHLNRHVKHRESFRPFAPIVREHLAPRYFDVAYPSPFMLFNTTVRAEYRDRLPAICHVDGTARLQTIHERDHPWMHALLAAWERVDEHGVLLNTSFNDAGEPIVETAEDAWRCFARTGIDALVCGNAIVLKDDVYVRPAAVAKRAPDGDPSRSGDLAARAAHT
jgi:carbamoyltransferase